MKARRYRFGLTSSTARLDFRGYEGKQGMDLELELSAISSSVKILVPLGFEVRDQIQGRQSSTVKNRAPRGADPQPHRPDRSHPILGGQGLVPQPRSEAPFPLEPVLPPGGVRTGSSGAGAGLPPFLVKSWKG